MKNLLLIIILSFSQILSAQDKEKKKKSIKDLTKSSQKIDGLFPIFQDSTSGELKMLVTEEQLDKDFIYFSQIADGVTEAGSFRGAYGSDVIFHIQKYYNKIEFVAPNTNFYFDPENPLSRSQEANTSHAIISSNKILAS